MRMAKAAAALATSAEGGPTLEAEGVNAVSGSVATTAAAAPLSISDTHGPSRRIEVRTGGGSSPHG